VVVQRQRLHAFRGERLDRGEPKAPALPGFQLGGGGTSYAAPSKNRFVTGSTTIGSRTAIKYEAQADRINRVIFVTHARHAGNVCFERQLLHSGCPLKALLRRIKEDEYSQRAGAQEGFETNHPTKKINRFENLKVVAKSGCRQKSGSFSLPQALLVRQHLPRTNTGNSFQLVA